MEQDNKFTDQSHWDDYWANYKYGITDVTLLDFHMNLEIVRTFKKINGLPQSSSKQKWIRLLSYLIKIWPFKGRFFSPFIAIYARK